MIEKIKKRDGREIVFVPEKITRAIFLAASAVAKEEGKEADYEESERLTDQVVGNLNRKFSKDVPNVEQVQDMVVRTLIESGHAKTSEAYILYRSERTKTRNIHSHLMNAVREITYDDVTIGEHEENVNVNPNTTMGTMLRYGSAVSKEFCLNQVISPKFASMHMQGDIYIHNLEFMNTGSFESCQIDLDKLFHGGFSSGYAYLREPQDIASYAALTSIALQSNQNDEHKDQSIPAFDTYLARGVAKTFHKLYISNLRKAIYLIVGKDIEVKEDMKNLEMKSSSYPKLDMDYTFLDCLKEYLKSTCNINDETIERILLFTYKESRDECDKQTFQAMEGFLHNLSSIQSFAGAQVPITSINFGTDTTIEGRILMKNLLLAQEAGLGNGETPKYPTLIFKVKNGVNALPKDPNYDLFQLSMRVSAKRNSPSYSFLDASYNIGNYQEHNIKSEVALMDCGTRVLENINGEVTSIGRGILSTTTINLVRLGIKHGVVGSKEMFDRNNFFKELEEVVDLTIDQLLERGIIQASKHIKNFPFLMGQGVWKGADEYDWEDTLQELVKQGSYALGYVGLSECLIALYGEHHGYDNESQALGLEIINCMKDKCDEASRFHKMNISVKAVMDKDVCESLIRLDKKMFGTISQVTDHDFYIEGNALPTMFDDVQRKIEIEGMYHKLTLAGNRLCIGMDTNNLDTYEQAIQGMKDAGIGYGMLYRK